MFRKILYPIDSFEEAFKASAKLKKLKEAGTREVVVLGIVTLKGCEWTGRSLKECQIDSFGKEKAKMEAILKVIEENGLKGKPRIEIGRRAHTVLKVADEEEVSLIAIGPGSENIKGLLLGRVTAEVIRHAKVPVLVMK